MVNSARRHATHAPHHSWTRALRGSVGCRSVKQRQEHTSEQHQAGMGGDGFILAYLAERDRVVFINGTGGTSQTELNILYRRAHQNLVERGFEIAGSVVSSLFTTQEMGGFSISLGVVDPEMKALWEAPAYSPSFFRN